MPTPQTQDMRSRLRSLQSQIDSVRGAYASHGIPTDLQQRWESDTYRTSLARSKVIACFAIAYAVVSLLINPEIRQLIAGQMGSALWPAVIRCVMIVSSLWVIYECSRLPDVELKGNSLHRAKLVVRSYILIMLGCVAADLALFPGFVPDLTGYAIAMTLVAVALVTPDRFRYPLYLATALVASVGWWLAHAPLPDTHSALMTVSVYTTLIAFMCIALDRLTHQQRVESMLNLRQAQLQEAIAKELLNNTLPQPVSRELSNQQGAIAQQHDQAVVLFADLVGFTSMAARMPPAELLTMLDDVFRRFDDLVVKHGLEKIKTIGDAYMAASGLTESSPSIADDAVRLGVSMHEAVRDFNGTHGTGLQLRIGVHTGPVVAGVIGDLRFAYDVWGDTVNTASRLESSGVPGRVHISHALLERLKEKSVATRRGEIEMKGLGKVETWLV